MRTEVHPDDVQHRKLRIAARAQRLVWSNAAKYGTKIQAALEVSGKIEMTEDKRLARIEQILALARRPKLEVSVEVHDEELEDE